MKAALIFSFVIAVILPPAVFAQDDDAMEVQRCIWQCLADSSGADDPAYNQCVANLCNAGGEAGSDGTASSSGQWQYGNHPLLGDAAFIDTDNGAIGVSCTNHADYPSNDKVVDLRITTGLFQNAPSVTLLFDDSSAAFSVSSQSGTEATLLEGNTCSVGLQSFMSASKLFVVPGEIGAIESVGSATQMTINQDGRTETATSGAEALDKLGGLTVSLKGSSKAINRMLAQCPSARRDIEDNCGI